MAEAVKSQVTKTPGAKADDEKDGPPSHGAIP
jgi:hypothetical protein